MITGITAAINILASLLLIVLVLLHSGKGGGLSDMFGGGMGSSAMGSTVMERNLDRLTVVVALVASASNRRRSGSAPFQYAGRTAAGSSSPSKRPTVRSRA